MNEKNIGLIGVIIVLLVGAALVFNQKNSAQSPVDLQSQKTESQSTDNMSNTSDSINADSSETSDWKTYEDEKAGFSFQSPADIAFNGTDEMEKEDYDNGALSILVEPLAGMEEGALGYEKGTLTKVKTALEKNEYGPDVNCPLDESKKVINLGKANAQTFTVFACTDNSAFFAKHILFFNNGYLVDITLHAPLGEMVSTNSEYFNTEEMGWKFEEDDNIISRFYQNLEDGKCSETAQDWKDTFDKIVSTIEIR